MVNSTISSYPMPLPQVAASHFENDDDDDSTIIASNCSSTHSAAKCTSAIPRKLEPEHQHYANILIKMSHAIADTGATSIFVMEGTPMENVQPTAHPITINLPDGKKVLSTHTCDIRIPGLPTVLTGHIVPGIKMASLFGIRVLCNAGCTVTFDAAKCVVKYNTKVILRGYKDPSTDLWTLPLTPTQVCTTQGTPVRVPHVELQAAPSRKSCVSLDASLMMYDPPTVAALSRPGPCIGRAPHIDFAGFSYARTTKANAVKFAHQGICNPPISSLLKAIKANFLKGAPNLDLFTVRKYLMSSPATSKGHMKRPRKGLRSTTKLTPKPITNPTPQCSTHTVRHVAAEKQESEHEDDDTSNDDEPQQGYYPNIIPEIEDESIANVFCFGAFADKLTGVVYNDCTGNFPFMSLDGNVCFLVMYHYETNAIFAVAIPGLDSKSILEAYKKIFEYLVSKGYKPKVNVMDNQATKTIKEYLLTQQCALQLVEPHNHRVNAAERAIQTFKNRFIAALGTTDSEFPVQLWDKMAPQVQDSINLLRPSRIDPTKSAYEILEGPYDWNRYPLAPLGTRAIIYEDPESRGSWAPHGLDAWLLGPSKDHYRCNLYYVPETRGYRISAAADLFPQHCIAPSFTPDSHVKELSNELQDNLKTIGRKARTVQVMRDLAIHLEAYITGNPPPQREQRVKQRVMNDVHHITPPLLQRVSDTPRMTTANNPTSKRVLQTKIRTHKRTTRGNIPGALPMIIRPNIIEHINDTVIPSTKRVRITKSHTKRANASATTPRRSTRLRHIAPPANVRFRNSRIISQEAINLLLMDDIENDWSQFTPLSLRPQPIHQRNYAHYAMPMVHPVTGETITSYKKLMKDPVTRETWMTAFGKDFGGMAQGDNKTGQVGTNAMFVMDPTDIPNIPTNRTVTYANVVVDYRPQKTDPNRIRITAGGNLINYPGELTTRTADITTSKLHWNSVLSTQKAKYMCLDLKNFYLSAPLDRYEYMRIPFELFPPWIVAQYNLLTKIHTGHIYLEMRRAVWGLPQAGILANKLLRKRLAPHGYYECKQTPGLWKHTSRHISFTLVVDDFGVKYTNKKDIEHLIDHLKTDYELTEDWDGDLYCGIKLKWDYVARTLDISMPGYIIKQLQKYKHACPPRPQHCPYSPEPKRYGSDAQRPLPEDTSPPLSKEDIKHVQRVIGSILYYARAVDLTVLMALSTIASEQAKGTESTMAKTKQLLDYLATNPDATIRFHASDMILNIHSDASYLSAANAHSRACGHFFMGWKADPTKPIKLNGAFFTLCAILRFVVASAAEAELGALFLNCKQATIFRLTLEEMGHPQPPTLVHCDNSTAVGIANNSVKKQRSRSMEMRFFWVADAVEAGKFDIKYYPGKENLADYQSKHHIGAHHTAVRPWYLHEQNSVRELPRACKPSTLKGCVGTIPDGYVRTNPLPQVPTRQSVPTTRKHIPGYLGLPIGIPTLRSIIAPAIARVQTPWLSFH